MKKDQKDKTAPFKIGIVGTHGVGKTTFAIELKKKLNERYPYKNIFIINEVPRSLVQKTQNNRLLVPENNTLTLQFIIMLFQLMEEQKNNIIDSFTICDRTLLDHFLYTIYFHKKQFKQHEELLIQSLLMDYMNTYDIIFYIPVEFAIEDDSVRITQEDFQKNIDLLILDYLNKISFVKISGDITTRIDCALNSLSKAYEQK